jgi:uncharacterized small protein (DUF1192 family)
LLPSDRVRRFTEKAVVVGVRKADPACEAWRKEFDVRATAWVIVLDPRGERLDSWMADATGLLKNKDTLDKFPAHFADKLEDSLRRKETLEDLERRWEAHPADESAFDKLASRLEELMADRRTRELCEKFAALPGLPADRRGGALLRGFIARSREYGALATAEALDRFVQEGERLIAEQAAHPKAPQAAESLFRGGYANRFDVPGRSAAGIARIEALAQGLKDPGPLRERIGELTRLRQKEIERLQAARTAAKGNEANEGYYAVMLGDAETTVRLYSKPPYDTHAYYKTWVQEAREKLQKGNAEK